MYMYVCIHTHTVFFLLGEKDSETPLSYQAIYIFKILCLAFVYICVTFGCTSVALSSQCDIQSL